MNLDLEWKLSPLLASYFRKQLAKTTTDTSPVIAFFDPMAIDEANRIVIESPKALVDRSSADNFSAAVKITVKSQLGQIGTLEDLKAHFQRVNEVRGKLFGDTFCADVSALSAEVVITDCLPKFEFETDYTRVGFIFSETTITLNGYAL